MIFSMPVMLYDISVLASEPISTFLSLVALNTTMLVTGVIGRLNVLGPLGALFWVVSCMVFVKELTLINHCFVRIRAKAEVQSVKIVSCNAERSMRACHHYTMVLWILFPLAELLHISGLVSSPTAESIWCFLDYFAKSVYTAMVRPPRDV